ncbi:Cation channel sperm-associated protein 1 [Allomyces arbusculus]|nr:Cation channel sperm-associated protein 1 [Allomyces arbusculus]
MLRRRDDWSPSASSSSSSFSLAFTNRRPAAARAAPASSSTPGAAPTASRPSARASAAATGTASPPPLRRSSMASSTRSYASTSAAGWASTSHASASASFDSLNGATSATDLDDWDAASLSRMASSAASMAQSVDPHSVLRAELAHDPHAWVRRYCLGIVASNTFSSAILLVILVNTVVLAIQTTSFLSTNFGWYLTLLDQIFLGIYLMETITKFYVYRLAYFKSGWNNFDLVIVLTSVFSFLLPALVLSSSGGSSTMAFNPKVIRLFRVFRAFRAIRSLRALRAITFLSSLQVLVQTLLQSIPAMSSIVALAALVLYIFSVIGRTLYATVDPWRFSSLPKTMFRLFATLTLDDWSKIFWDNRAKDPNIFVFLFFFVFLEAFVFLNLFVAVIVSNLEQLQSRADAAARRRAARHRARASLPFRTTPAAAAAIPNLDSTDLGTSASNEGLASTPTGPGGGAITPTVVVSPAAAATADAPVSRLFEQELGLDNYYSPNLPASAKAVMARYLMLAASLEQNGYFYAAQQKIVDDLVDLVQAKGDGGT